MSVAMLEQPLGTSFASNNWKSILFLTSLVLSLNIRAKAQNRSLIADGAKLTLVSDQFSFTEGPAADSKGNVYFTDQPNDKIWKYSKNGKLSVYMDKSGRANGLFFDNSGNLLACADGDNELWQIDKNKNIEILAKNWEESRYNGPNDLWVDDKGGIYFTDPFYKRPYWNHTESEQEEQRVYYRSPAGKISIAADGFKRPNGIVGSRAASKLYITDIGDSKTYSYTIAEDGSLNNKLLFCKQGSDGLTIDNLGNIYLVGKGVSIYTADGELREKIEVPQPWTANITFGGKKRDLLFITASKAIYTLKMNVKGVR